MAQPKLRARVDEPIVHTTEPYTRHDWRVELAENRQYVTTTFSFLYLWTAPVAGMNRRGQPCRIVKKKLPMPDRQTVTVEFADGVRLEAPRRAVRVRKWARPG